MEPDVKPSRRARLRSPAVWLPLAACAMVAGGAWLRGPAIGRTANPAPVAAAAVAATTAAPAPTQPSDPAVVAPPTGMPPMRAAAIGPTSVEVIVARNDTLDRIFRRLQINLADLASLRSLPGIKHNVDQLRPGEALTLQHREGELLGLTRRLNLEETLQVVKSSDGFQVNVLKNALETRTRTVSATIEHSLFEAVTAAGAHDQTAVALADIFAWDIDFVLDIQPGDSFTVTYDEVYENGKYLQDGPILAARFVNQGRAYQAVRYTAPNGRSGYYDPEGRSLRKAFLRAPLEFTRVSSRFDLRRHHPILNLIRAHKGVDYAAPVGTPVRAAGDGRVAFAGQKGGYGNLVEIDHAHGIVTVYGHLSRFAHGMRAGRQVQQGEVIAFVGMTGLATGPHLHYEYRVNGVQRNPQTVGLPDAVPIEAALRDDFIAKTRPLIATLYPPVGPALVSR